MRAQLIGQIFVYILVIVIVSVILLYGVNAIVKFKEKTEQITLFELKNDLKNTIKKITITTDRIEKKLNIPGKYREVCFVKTYGGLPLNPIPDAYPIMKQSAAAGITKNVFLVENIEEEPFDVGAITVGNKDYFCINVTNGMIDLKIEGKGDHADISRW